MEPRVPDLGNHLKMTGVGNKQEPNRSLQPRTPPQDAQWYAPECPAGVAAGRRGFLRKRWGYARKGRVLPSRGSSSRGREESTRGKEAFVVPVAQSWSLGVLCPLGFSDVCGEILKGSDKNKAHLYKESGFQQDFGETPGVRK